MSRSSGHRRPSPFSWKSTPRYRRAVDRHHNPRCAPHWRRGCRESTRSGLASREFDGETFYWEPEPELTRDAVHAVHALPGFDEYVLGHQDRTVSLPDAVSERVIPGNNGLFRPTIVVDGEVVGTWGRTGRSTRIEIEIKALQPLSTQTRALINREFERFATFVGKPVTMR